MNSSPSGPPGAWPALEETFTDDQELGEALEVLASTLPQVLPSPALRDRLMGSVSPWRQFTAALASLFEIGVDTATSYLGRLRDPSAWELLAPGAALMHVQGGPSTATADVGFVRVADGVQFPAHHHLGEERTLVLQGVCVNSDGTRRGPGDTFIQGAGTDHIFRADGELIFAVVVWGVRFDDELLYQSPA